MKKSIVPAFLKRYKAIAILAVLLLFMAVIKPSLYNPANIRNLFLKVSIQGIIGFGMTFTLIAGEFDMSVGSVLTLSGIIFATLLSRICFFPAALITIVAGSLMGLFNGLLVSKLKLSSFIATLGSLYIFKAIALMISKGNPIKISNETAIAISNYRIGENTIFPFVFLFIGVLTHYLLKRSKMGRNIYAVGGNMDVASNAGIDVTFYKTLVFVIVCASSALAGILMTLRLQSATTIAGDDISLTVVSSVIIGGTSPAGGVGGAIESFIGLFIIAVVTSSLDLLGISGYYQQVVQGFLTVLIIGTTSYSTYRNTTSV